MTLLASNILNNPELNNARFTNSNFLIRFRSVNGNEDQTKRLFTKKIEKTQ